MQRKEVIGTLVALGIPMGRRPRIESVDLHYHVIVRCNNGAFHFNTDEDFLFYLQVLRKFKRKHQFRLFNYVLMHSHVHLFIQPSEKVPLHKTMLLINGTYARHYNKRKKRKGHFWLDRYKSIPVARDDHALALMRYINRNPIRAGITAKPEAWRWSGYGFYAFAEPNDLLDEHSAYLDLSAHPEKRRTEYINLVSIPPAQDRRDPSFSDASCIGNDSFRARLGLVKKP